MRRSLVLVIASFLLISAASSAFAQEGDQVGSVIAIRGKATAFDPKGVVRELSIKSPVFRHDTLKTGPQGRIQVLFSDNTIVSLGKESQMEITEHFWKPGQKTGAMKTKVKEGVFRVMGGAIAKDSPESFTTETPAATIGIRGSMYAGRVTEDTLSVVFEGGKGIYVVNDAGTVTITSPGFGTRIRGLGNRPEKPARTSIRDISSLNNDLSVNGEQTEQDNGSAPVQEEERSSSSQEQAGISVQEDGSSSGPSQEEPQSSTGDQDQVAQDGDTGTGLSDLETAGATQPVDTSLAASGTGGSSAITMPPFFEQNPISSNIDPVTAITGISAISQDKLETSVQDQVSSDPAVTPPTVAYMSGASMSALNDINNYWNTNNNYWYSESLTATSTDGLVTGTFTTQDGIPHTFTFSIPPYNPQGTYTSSGIHTYTSPYTIPLLGADRTFIWKITSDPLGEFVFYDTFGSFTQTASYDFAELGYAGVPSASTLRTNGVDLYQGRALGFEIIGPVLTARKDFGAGNMAMEVNWLNGKAIGVMDLSNFDTSVPAAGDSRDLLFFFGTVDRTTGTLTNVYFIGNRGPEETDPTGPVAWIEGSTFSGRFYGSDNQGFGFMSTGNDFDVRSNMTTRVGISRFDGAMLKDAQDPTDVTSPTGYATFSGFAVGIAERMSDPAVARRRFMNTDPNNFILSINRELGTVAGTLSASDTMYPGSITLSNIEIGGSHGSAYVLDDNFAAFLGDTGNDSVNVLATTGGLKRYANFLVTAKPDNQVNEYVTWGYWEIAYFDPTSPDPANPLSYHVHQPGAFWIAGEITNPAVIQSMASNSLMGQYIGTAHGVKFDSSSQLQPLANGAANLSVNFGSASISGSITFTGAQFNFANGLINNADSRFSADINGTADGFTATGGAFGAFYGPGADAVGGNFSVQNGGGVTYMGIFNGGKQ